jgi:hypothetical protein
MSKAMKIKISSKKLFFKISLIIFLSYFQTVSSYIYKIRYYYNSITKKTICMLSDWHIMGDEKQNLEQFEKFKKICELLKKKETKSQVLFELRCAYTLEDCNIPSGVMCEKIASTDIKYNVKITSFEIQSSVIKPYQMHLFPLRMNGYSWLIDLWVFALKDINSFVKYKSIDPRLLILPEPLWTSKNKVAAGFVRTSWLINFKNLLLYKQKKYMEKGILGNALLAKLNKIFEEMKSEDFLQKIIECHESKEKILEVLKVELYKNRNPFFIRPLEHEALLNMCCDHDFKYTFLLAGGNHTTYLKQYLLEFGFKLVDKWGIFTEKAFKLGFNLPNKLQQEMNMAFSDIYNKIEKDSAAVSIPVAVLAH